MRAVSRAHPDDGTPALLLAWFLGTWLLWLFFGRLKQVALEGDQLVVSNYRDTIWIPVHAVGAVKQNVFSTVRPVRIVLTEETQFGHSILFLPRPPHGLFSESQVVGRLRRMAGLEHAS